MYIVASGGFDVLMTCQDNYVGPQAKEATVLGQNKHSVTSSQNTLVFTCKSGSNSPVFGLTPHIHVMLTCFVASKH